LVDYDLSGAFLAILGEGVLELFSIEMAVKNGKLLEWCRLAWFVGASLALR